MTPPLEIIIPIRNPGTILAQTINSLTAQTDRRFCVLLSDNFSSSGLEHFEAAEIELKKAEIPVCRVKPPRELKRVEHWNWAHSQGHSEWLKPLFVGDRLMPAYVEKTLARVDAGTPACIIRCEFDYLTPTFNNNTVAPTKKTFLSPTDFLDYFPAMGNWLGSPVNMAYKKSAWRAAGGYSVHLPACADYCLYATLTLMAGLEIVHEVLASFQFHQQRFSHGIVRRRVKGPLELWLILRQTRNYCRNANLPWPSSGVFRGMWFQFKMDNYYPWKKRMKQRLLFHR